MAKKGTYYITTPIYYPSSNLLSLVSVTLTPPSGNTSPGLKFSANAANTVQLTGVNEITANKNNAIWSYDGSISFTGTGKLTATSKESTSCYYAAGATSITFNVEQPVTLTGAHRQGSSHQV